MNGDVKILTSVDPWIVETPPFPPGAQIVLDPTGPPLMQQTDSNGNFGFVNVPVGGYSIDSSFDEFYDDQVSSQSGSIDFAGQVRTHQFRGIQYGDILVAVEDTDGNPVPDASVNISSDRQDLGDGFKQPSEFCSGPTSSEAPDLGMFLCSSGQFGNEGAAGPGMPLGSFQVTVTDDQFESFGVASGVVTHAGENVELTVVLAAGDVTEVQFNPVEFGGNDVIETVVEFATDISSLEEIDLVVEFDTDQDSNTGFSDIFSPYGPTDIGAEVRVFCFDGGCSVGFDEPVDLGAGFFGDFPLEFGTGPNEVVMRIPVEEFGEVLPPNANVALLSNFLIFGGEGRVSDVVPNGGNVAISLVNPNAAIDDPLGDTFDAFASDEPE